MSSKQATPRRVRVPGERNANVYRRYDGRFEVGYRDSTGRQRWTEAIDTITAARARRDDVLGRKGKGEHVQPNPRLKFGEAADRWLADQVVELRPQTRAAYTSHVETHLRDRWGRRRLDTITVDDAAKLVRELRAEGMAESSIASIVAVAGRVFKFAARRMAWHGVNPIPLMENGERPKTAARKRRIYQGDELAQTLAAAHGQWKTLFSLACVTGARQSELLGLQWRDLDLADAEQASVRIGEQVDRKGKRQPLKTEDSDRTVEIPPSLARILLEHRAESSHCGDGDFVFSTKSGKALSQRNSVRALRAAQKRAKNSKGKPTFPVLHEDGPVPPGSVPTFHGFRHTAASQAIAAGDSAEEVSWMLGHKDSTITRAVYIQEIASAERRARMRGRLQDRFGAILDGAGEPVPEAENSGVVVPLRQVVNA